MGTAKDINDVEHWITVIAVANLTLGGGNFDLGDLFDVIVIVD